MPAHGDETECKVTRAFRTRPASWRCGFVNLTIGRREFPRSLANQPGSYDLAGYISAHVVYIVELGPSTVEMLSLWVA